MPARQVTLYVDADRPDLSDVRFPFTGNEVADAALYRYNHSNRKMHAAEALFLKEIVSNVPLGIHIDANLIDIDTVEASHHGSTSTMSYAQNIQLPMSDACSTALADYHRYKSEVRRFWRQHRLFLRIGEEVVQLSEQDADNLRMFEPFQTKGAVGVPD